VDRFIVGTGRCGSTLLSRMLGQHPRILSVFEFFNGLDLSKRFRPGPVDGVALRDLIGAEQPFVNAVLRRGYPVSEVVYPFGRRGARHVLGDAVPWLLVTMLPRISDEPDALFDALLARALEQPRKPLAQHYRDLFEWLCDRFDKDVWIERSGSSIEYLPALRELHPQARFLHLHRDGGEVALSMREHHAYRLPISLLYDVPLDGGVRVSEAGPFDVYAQPDERDLVSRILASRPPPAPFGRYWSDQIARGLAQRESLQSDQYLALSFEDLVERPEAILKQISSFFELPPDGEWIRAAADLVRGSPQSRVQGLSRSDRSALRDACEPGRRLLADS
jgi:hypothetical protein